MSASRCKKTAQFITNHELEPQTERRDPLAFLVKNQTGARCIHSVSGESRVEPEDSHNWRCISSISPTNATARYHAIDDDGSLWGWGAAPVGDGTMFDRRTPVRIGQDTDWVSVSEGLAHTIAMKQDGSAWVIGSNGSGQHGNGGYDNDVMQSYVLDLNGSVGYLFHDFQRGLPSAPVGSQIQVVPQSPGEPGYDPHLFPQSYFRSSARTIIWAADPSSPNTFPDNWPPKSEEKIVQARDDTELTTGGPGTGFQYELKYEFSPTGFFVQNGGSGYRVPPVAKFLNDPGPDDVILPSEFRVICRFSVAGLDVEYPLDLSSISDDGQVELEFPSIQRNSTDLQAKGTCDLDESGRLIGVQIANAGQYTHSEPIPERASIVGNLGRMEVPILFSGQVWLLSASVRGRYTAFPGRSIVFDSPDGFGSGASALITSGSYAHASVRIIHGGQGYTTHGYPGTPSVGEPSFWALTSASGDQRYPKLRTAVGEMCLGINPSPIGVIRQFKTFNSVTNINWTTPGWAGTIKVSSINAPSYDSSALVSRKLKCMGHPDIEFDVTGNWSALPQFVRDFEFPDLPYIEDRYAPYSTSTSGPFVPSVSYGWSTAYGHFAGNFTKVLPAGEEATFQVVDNVLGGDVIQTRYLGFNGISQIDRPPMLDYNLRYSSAGVRRPPPSLSCYILSDSGVGCRVEATINLAGNQYSLTVADPGSGYLRSPKLIVTNRAVAPVRAAGGMLFKELIATDNGCAGISKVDNKVYAWGANTGAFVSLNAVPGRVACSIYAYDVGGREGIAGLDSSAFAIADLVEPLGPPDAPRGSPTRFIGIHRFDSFVSYGPSNSGISDSVRTWAYQSELRTNFVDGSLPYTSSVSGPSVPYRREFVAGKRDASLPIASFNYWSECPADYESHQFSIRGQQGNPVSIRKFGASFCIQYGDGRVWTPLASAVNADVFTPPLTTKYPIYAQDWVGSRTRSTTWSMTPQGGLVSEIEEFGDLRREATQIAEGYLFNNRLFWYSQFDARNDSEWPPTLGYANFKRIDWSSNSQVKVEQLERIPATGSLAQATPYSQETITVSPGLLTPPFAGEVVSGDGAAIVGTWGAGDQSIASAVFFIGDTSNSGLYTSLPSAPHGLFYAAVNKFSTGGREITRTMREIGGTSAKMFSDYCDIGHDVSLGLLDASGRLWTAQYEGLFFPDPDQNSYAAYNCPRDRFRLAFREAGCTSTGSLATGSISAPFGPTTPTLPDVVIEAENVAEDHCFTDVPCVVCDQPDPDTATAEADLDGRVKFVGIEKPGAKVYEREPIVIFSRVPEDQLGEGATARVILRGPVGRVEVTSGGSGYLVAPDVKFAGIGFRGKAISHIDETGSVTSVEITEGGDYLAAPEVIFEPVSAVRQINVTSQGVGYETPPEVVIVPTGSGSGASAVAVLNASGGVDQIVLTNRGRGYDTPPIVRLNGGGGVNAVAVALVESGPTEPAEAVAKIAGTVYDIEVTGEGSRYQFSPDVFIVDRDGDQLYERFAAGEISRKEYESHTEVSVARSMIVGPADAPTITRPGNHYCILPEFQSPAPRLAKRPEAVSSPVYYYSPWVGHFSSFDHFLSAKGTGRHLASAFLDSPITHIDSIANNSFASELLTPPGGGIVATGVSPNVLYTAKPQFYLDGAFRIFPQIVTNLRRTCAAVARDYLGQTFYLEPRVIPTGIDFMQPRRAAGSNRSVPFSDFIYTVSQIEIHSKILETLTFDYRGFRRKLSDLRWSPETQFEIADIEGNGAEVAASIDSSGLLTSLSVTSQGQGYTDECHLSIRTAKPRFSQCTATAVLGPGGSIARIVVADKGMGYKSPVVAITGGSGSGAVAVAVQFGGPLFSVDSIRVVSGGVGYTTPPEIVVYDSGDDWGDLASAINEAMKNRSMRSVIRATGRVDTNGQVTTLFFRGGRPFRPDPQARGRLSSLVFREAGGFFAKFLQSGLRVESTSQFANPPERLHDICTYFIRFDSIKSYDYWRHNRSNRFFARPFESPPIAQVVPQGKYRDATIKASLSNLRPDSFGWAFLPSNSLAVDEFSGHYFPGSPSRKRPPGTLPT